MKKIFAPIFVSSVLFLLSCLPAAAAFTKVQNWCEVGGQTINVLAYASSGGTPVQRSYPGCTVTVTVTGGGGGTVSTSGTTVTWVSGTAFNNNGQWNGLTISINSINYTIASVISNTSLTTTTALPTLTSAIYGVLNAPAAIFSDSGGTPLSNPFTADINTGYWSFYAADGEYDVQLSGASMPAIVLGDITVGGNGGGGGGGGGGGLPLYTAPVTNAVARSIVTGPISRLSDTISSFDLGALGNCVTDDTVALQNLFNLRRAVTIPKPPGGCYLVSNVLAQGAALQLQPGTFVVGASNNDPNAGDPNAGSVIRLAPHSNVPIINLASPNEYVGMENIVLDGNGPNQDTQLMPWNGTSGAACLQWNGGYIENVLEHIVVTNCFGSGFIGQGNLYMLNDWFINNSNSSYTFINNGGTLSGTQLFVEDQCLPSGGSYVSCEGNANFGDPTKYSHAILMATQSEPAFGLVHCESAQTCIDVQFNFGGNIQEITGNRIGNPSSSDPTNQYLVRFLDDNTYNWTFGGAYFDQSGTTYPGSFANVRIIGLAQGVNNNDIYQTPAGTTTWSQYIWGNYNQQGFAPYLGSRSIVGNELWVQPLGSYSPAPSLKWCDQTPTCTANGVGTAYYGTRGGPNFNFGYQQGNTTNDFFRTLWNGSISSSTFTIPGEQFFLVSSDGGHAANLIVDNSTGNLTVSASVNNFLWYQPNAYFGFNGGNGNPGTGVNYQNISSGSAYFLRGLMSQGIVYSAPGNFTIGTNGGGDYASMVWVNGGGTCFDNATGQAQPGTITETSYIGHARLCVGATGSLMYGKGFNSDKLLNDDGNALQFPNQTVEVGNIVTTNAANTDLTGELSLSAATSTSYAFTNTYLSHPECVLTPQFNPGAAVSWITYTGASAFTVNFSSAVTGSVSYVCVGRN